MSIGCCIDNPPADALANVNSVSNSDGTLTISPTTGAVVASLALSHANAWTGQQTFGTTSPIFSTITAGSVFFAGTSGLLSQDNSNFFWDNTGKQLGVGTGTVSAAIHAKVSNTNNFTGILAEQASTGNIGYQLLITGVQAYVLAIDHKGASNNLAITNSSATPGAGNTIITFNTDKTITIPTDAALKFTNQSNGAASGAGTLTNAPKVGNPDIWIPISVNGTAGWIPWWHA